MRGLQNFLFFFSILRYSRTFLTTSFSTSLILHYHPFLNQFSLIYATQMSKPSPVVITSSLIFYLKWKIIFSHSISVILTNMARMFHVYCSWRPFVSLYVLKKTEWWFLDDLYWRENLDEECLRANETFKNFKGHQNCLPINKSFIFS